VTKRTVKLGPIGPDINLDQEEVYLSDGTRLTEAEAEAFSKRVVEQARRRGRPSISEATVRTPNLTVRVSPDVRAALESIAETQGRRLADVSRDALAEYVERHAC
jgi:hypothetical protein